MTGAQRAHAAQLMGEMYRFRSQLDYPPGDQRTNRDASSWHLSEGAMLHLLATGGRAQFDCSEYVPWVLRCAVGHWLASDPGWTGAHLQWWAARGWQVYTDGRSADPGAIVIFGPGSGHHEAVVKVADHRGGDPIVSSHGHAGLDELRVSALAASQAAEGFPGVRYLSVTEL